jgi:hypothetical protein
MSPSANLFCVPSVVFAPLLFFSGPGYAVFDEEEEEEEENDISVELSTPLENYVASQLELRHEKNRIQIRMFQV